MTKENETNRHRTTRSLIEVLALAFFGLSAIVLLVSSVLQLIASIQTQQIVILNQQQLIAREASEAVSRFIDEKFTLLEATADIADLPGASTEQKTTILRSVLGYQPAFRQILLINSTGKESARASRISQELSDQFIDKIQDDTSILTQTEKGQRYATQVYLDDNTSEPLVVLAIPVTNVFGDFEGTLVAELNLKFMWMLVGQLEVGETGYAYVVDDQGNLIAFRDISRVLLRENLAHLETVNEFITREGQSKILEQENVSITTGINGKKVVAHYSPLNTVPWAIVTELPWQEAYREVIIQGTWLFAIALGMALLAGLAGVFIARRLAVPLIDLADVATEIAAGNLNLQATVLGPAEVARVASTFNTMTSRLRELIGGLEQRVRERTTELEQRNVELELRSTELQVANQRNIQRASQFEAIAQVSGAVVSIRSLDELLPRITQLISEQFGFYHVGIFLNDASNQYANLCAANSEGGQRMLARKHQLKIGVQGIVGSVASTGTPRIALDVGEDATYFNNPDLPATHSEMALPLMVGKKIVGVLDVQSTESGAFDQDDLQVLSILAEQVSLAIENARLFEESRKSLAEAEALYRQYLRQAWGRMPREQRLEGYLYSPMGSMPIEHIDEMRREQSDQSKRPEIAVPIMLRGESIGMLAVQVPDAGQLNEDQMDLMKAVAERVAISAENARLFEETTRRAERERLVTDITAKIRSTNDPDVMIRTALNELKLALGATKVQLVPHMLEDGTGTKPESTTPPVTEPNREGVKNTRKPGGKK